MELGGWVSGSGNLPPHRVAMVGRQSHASAAQVAGSQMRGRG